MMRARNTTTNTTTSSGSGGGGSNVASPPTTSAKIRSRLNNPTNKNSNTGALPFSLIVIMMIFALFGMGIMSIYSMLYLTNNGMITNNQNQNHHLRPPRATSTDAHQAIQKVRDAFAERYGSYSATLLERGLTAFGSIDATAHRMVQASIAGRPFVMAFSGYSITVGRGNFFHQSYPFVMEEILKAPMQTLLGMDLVVRNAAIGGIPSFPYGFCLEHFLGSDPPDVISWDYSMNEGPKDASVLESFLRQASQQFQNRPMMIVLDHNEKRMQLLKDYTTKGYLSDAIAVGFGKEVVDDSVFQPTDPNMDVAPGFQEWDQFGAPKGCPGRGNWHPKRQEHAMIGWIMAMHFLKAMERAYELLSTTDVTSRQEQEEQQVPIAYPAPLTRIANNDQEVNDLLYGHEDHEQYFMKDVSCRTSFLPATDHSKVLHSVVMSGMMAEQYDLDIMVDRTDAHYQEGWVLDVSKVERDTKRKVEQCGGLGYVDMKIALYGIRESGTLRLWLPFEKGHENHQDHIHDHDHLDPAAQDDKTLLPLGAKHWFDDLIICEANEKRGDEACKLHQDMDIVVGGVPVTTIRPIKGAGEYLKRQTCVNVGVPATAQITRLGQVGGTDGRPLSAEDKKKKFSLLDDTSIGLVVDITPKSKVTREGGACCLSHVVWEQH